jgi:hypothetical protein
MITLRIEAAIVAWVMALGKARYRPSIKHLTDEASKMQRAKGKQLDVAKYNVA